MSSPLVPTARASDVAARAAESRQLCGKVWQQALQVSSDGHDTAWVLDGHYVHGGAPLGFPCWTRDDGLCHLVYSTSDRADGGAWYLVKTATAEAVFNGDPLHGDWLAMCPCSGVLPQGRTDWTWAARDGHGGLGTSTAVPVTLTQCPTRTQANLVAQADYEPAADYAELEVLTQHCAQMLATFNGMPTRLPAEKLVSESAEPPRFDKSDDAQARVLTVANYFAEIDAAPEDLATPRTMDDMEPMKDFRIEALDKDSRNPVYGFEFALKKTLAGLNDLDAFDDHDWAPMVTDIVEQAADIAREWQAGLGFDTVNKFCMQVLSSGFVEVGKEAETGCCIERMKIFFGTVMKLHKEMHACQATVEDAAAAVKQVEITARSLDELNALAYEPSENPDAWWDDAPNKARLVELLRMDAFALEAFDAEDKGAVAAMCETFLETTLDDKLEETDDNLQARRKELMVARAALVQSCQKRVSELQAMLPTVEQKCATVSSDADALASKCATYSGQAQATIIRTVDRIAAVQQECRAATETRSQERVVYAERVRAINGDNEELARRMRELLSKVHSNETQLRELTTNDQDSECRFQIDIAAKSGDLGTLGGCRDEMHRLLAMADESKAVVERTKRIGATLLCDHPHSVKNNIQKDISLTQTLGRETDTAHFETFCDAWMKNMHDKLMRQHAQLDTEQEIAQASAQIRKYQTMRNKPKADDERRKRSDMLARKAEQALEITNIITSMTAIEASLEPVLQRLGSQLEPGRDDKLIQRIRKYVGNPPPTNPTPELANLVKARARLMIEHAEIGVDEQISQLSTDVESRRQQITASSPLMLTSAGGVMRCDEVGLTRQGSKPSQAALAKSVKNQQQRKIAEVEYHQLGQMLGKNAPVDDLDDPEPEPEPQEGVPPG